MERSGCVLNCCGFHCPPLSECGEILYGDACRHATDHCDVERSVAASIPAAATAFHLRPYPGGGENVSAGPNYGSSSNPNGDPDGEAQRLKPGDLFARRSDKHRRGSHHRESVSSATARPKSARFSTVTICSTENRLFMASLLISYGEIRGKLTSKSDHFGRVASACLTQHHTRHVLASSATNKPPTTDLAWKPTWRALSVKYRSESGTRFGVSLA